MKRKETELAIWSACISVALESSTLSPMPGIICLAQLMDVYVRFHRIIWIIISYIPEGKKKICYRRGLLVSHSVNEVELVFTWESYTTGRTACRVLVRLVVLEQALVLYIWWEGIKIPFPPNCWSCGLRPSWPVQFLGRKWKSIYTTVHLASYFHDLLLHEIHTCICDIFLPRWSFGSVCCWHSLAIYQESSMQFMWSSTSRFSSAVETSCFHV